MKQNSIETLPRLRPEKYENIFNVYEDKNTNRYYYNLLQTINLPTDLPLGYFNTYNVVYGDTWPYISYKNYKTTSIWWVILLVNNILNPVEPLIPGTTLKIPKIDVINTIISQINTPQE